MKRRRFFGVAATAPAAIVAQPAKAVVEMVEADIAPVRVFNRLPVYERPTSFPVGSYAMSEFNRLYLGPQMKALADAIDADIAKDIAKHRPFFAGDRW